MWNIAIGHVSRMVSAAAASPLPFGRCGKCVMRSPPYKRDRAASALSRIIETAHGAATRDDPDARVWRALCRPRPIAATLLGDPAQDSEAVRSLRSLLGAHGLLRRG
nr:hypothetical protein [Pandoravirus massiliensis]